MEENPLNDANNTNIDNTDEIVRNNKRLQTCSFTLKYKNKDDIMKLNDIKKIANNINNNNKNENYIEKYSSKNIPNIVECPEKEDNESKQDIKELNKEKSQNINKNKIQRKISMIPMAQLKKASSFKKKLSNNNIKRANSVLDLFENNINKKEDSKSNESTLYKSVYTFSLLNNQIEMNSNIINLIALSISINECRIYNDIKEYHKYYKCTIPWDNKTFYKERSIQKEYTEKTIPRWLGIKDNGSFKFTILSFCPFVFHHIRLIDNISIDDILSSLSPIKNFENINIKSMKVSGGRSSNSLINTWDKKYIIKTIDKNERKLLVEKMIEDYHCLMKESKSLLSRIYGIFKIEQRDKSCINIMIQKNMNDLPMETKILAFDIKGSTVDRQCINKNDTKLNKKELFEKYKNIVLKDIDFNIIGIKIVLEYNNWRNLISAIESDSMFLQNNEVTDYSLLIFIHKYRKEDLNKKKINNRIIPSSDKKYIFNFSIIDYLGSFNFEKRGEKLAKVIMTYIKNTKDKNFSVSDPYTYGKRFRNYSKKIILDG